MAGHRRPAASGGVVPDGVLGALPLDLAPEAAEMTLEFGPLHHAVAFPAVAFPALASLALAIFLAGRGAPLARTPRGPNGACRV